MRTNAFLIIIIKKTSTFNMTTKEIIQNPFTIKYLKLNILLSNQNQSFLKRNSN